MKSDYQKEEVAICLSVLLELMTILGTFRENIVLIGGWTPWFLVPEKRNEHTGSLDIDIALDFKHIDSAAYKSILQLLRERREMSFFRKIVGLVPKYESFRDPRDRKKYKTIKIGKQIWLAENLNVGIFRNGDPIPEAALFEEWKAAVAEGKPAWCYYGNESEKGKEYGKLYNWYAVIDPRGLAPKGWHVPSDNEWETLIGYLGGYSVAGGKMKSVSGWERNGNGTNESGFSALPGGYRCYNCISFFQGHEADFWSSSEHNNYFAGSRSLGCSYSRVNCSPDDKRRGLSVRCVKD